MELFRRVWEWLFDRPRMSEEEDEQLAAFGRQIRDRLERS